MGRGNTDLSNTQNFNPLYGSNIQQIHPHAIGCFVNKRGEIVAHRDQLAGVQITLEHAVLNMGAVPFEILQDFCSPLVLDDIITNHGKHENSLGLLPSGVTYQKQPTRPYISGSYWSCSPRTTRATAWDCSTSTRRNVV